MPSSPCPQPRDGELCREVRALEKRMEKIEQAVHGPIDSSIAVRLAVAEGKAAEVEKLRAMRAQSWLALALAILALIVPFVLGLLKKG